MRSTSAPRRPPTKLPRPCPQPLRVSPLRRPRACRRGCAPEIARIQPKNACFKPPIPKLGQSSAQDQRQSKSRKPSFESNVGGVGPVVADALDRPRRSILTGAAASKGGRLLCIDFRYNVSIFVTHVSNRWEFASLTPALFLCPQPLTYLKPTGRTEEVATGDATFTIVEVVPRL